MKFAPKILRTAGAFIFVSDDGEKNPCFQAQFSVSLTIFLIYGNIFIDRLVSDGQNLPATGHPRHVVTAIDKPIAIRANAYESMEESSNDIRHKPIFLIISMFFASNHSKSLNNSGV